MWESFPQFAVQSVVKHLAQKPKAGPVLLPVPVLWLCLGPGKRQGSRTARLLCAGRTGCLAGTNVSYSWTFSDTQVDYTAYLFWLDCVVRGTVTDSCHSQAGLKYTKTATCTRQNSIKQYLSIKKKKKATTENRPGLTPGFFAMETGCLETTPELVWKCKSQVVLSAVQLRLSDHPRDSTAPGAGAPGPAVGGEGAAELLLFSWPHGFSRHGDQQDCPVPAAAVRGEKCTLGSQIPALPGALTFKVKNVNTAVKH